MPAFTKSARLNHRPERKKEPDPTLPRPTFKDIDDGTVPLEKLKEGLTIRIPWDARFEGYNVSIYIVGDRTGVESHLFPNVKPTDYLEYYLPAEDLVIFHEQNVKLEYQVASPPNYPVSPTSTYKFAQDLYWPRIAGLDKLERGTLPWGIVKDGITISIPPYSSMTKGDKVSVFLAADAANSSLRYEHEVEDLAAEIKIDVPSDASKRAAGGTVRVIYNVQKPDQSIKISKALNFYCEPPTGIPLPDTPLEPEMFQPAIAQAVDIDGFTHIRSTFAEPITSNGKITLLLFTRHLDRNFIYDDSVDSTQLEHIFKVPIQDIASILLETIDATTLTSSTGTTHSSSTTQFMYY
ncbi:hypothetical protein [Pseudomonas monteilii]|nr:hypothetical protein [Pseudomonas monteilii]